MELKHISKIVAALEQLLTDYQQAHNQMNGEKLCCLCNTMKSIAAETGGSCCAACPWWVFTDKKCTDNFFEIVAGTQYDKTNNKWISARLEQLPVWIAGYRSVY